MLHMGQARADLEREVETFVHGISWSSCIKISVATLLTGWLLFCALFDNRKPGQYGGSLAHRTRSESAQAIKESPHQLHSKPAAGTVTTWATEARDSTRFFFSSFFISGPCMCFFFLTWSINFVCANKFHKRPVHQNKAMCKGDSGWN